MGREIYGPVLGPLLAEKDRLKDVENQPVEVYGKIMKKVSRLAIAENRWDAYFFNFYLLIFYANDTYEVHKGPSYVKELIKNSKAHLQDALNNSQTRYYTIFGFMMSFRSACEIYEEYYSVTDAQLDALYDMFWENVRLYGYEIEYWYVRLRLEIHRKNQQGIRKALKNFLSFESDNCYACEQKRVIKAYLALGETDAAMELCNKIIAGDIPKENLDTYDHCENRTLEMQYKNIINDFGVMRDNPELFDKLCPIYYDVLVEGTMSSFDMLAAAHMNNFEFHKNYIENIHKYEDLKLNSQFSYMEFCLFSWAYLTKAHENGIDKVEIRWNKPAFEGADQPTCCSLTAAKYFAQQAESVGRKFEKSQRAFNFDLTKAGVARAAKIANC